MKVGLQATEADFQRDYALAPDEVWERLRRAAHEHDAAMRAQPRPRGGLSTDGSPDNLRLTLGLAALVGKLEARDGGCHLSGRIGLHPNFKKGRPFALAFVLLFYWRALLPSFDFSAGLVPVLLELMYPLTFVGLLYFAFFGAARQAAGQGAELAGLVDAYLPGAHDLRV